MGSKLPGAEFVLSSTKELGESFFFPANFSCLRFSKVKRGKIRNPSYPHPPQIPLNILVKNK